MPARLCPPNDHDSPTMAVLSGVMTEPHTPEPDTPGAQLRAEIKRRRKARGWSIARLARESGVSDKTISRIENGTDYAGAGSLAKVAAALGIDHYAADGDPPLSTATPEEISSHIYRLLTEAAETRGVLEKIRGSVPPEILRRAGVYDPHNPRPDQPPRPHPGGHMGESGS